MAKGKAKQKTTKATIAKPPLLSEKAKGKQKMMVKGGTPRMPRVRAAPHCNCTLHVALTNTVCKCRLQPSHHRLRKMS